MGDEVSIKQLAGTLRGRLIKPEDPDYDEARSRDPVDIDKIQQSARDYWEAVHPHCAGASYINFMMEESGPAMTIPRDLLLETQMAEAESGDTRCTEAIGRLIAFACPDCNGPLWQLDSDAIERYRCHTSHAFTARAMTEDLAEASERAL